MRQKAAIFIGINSLNETLIRIVSFSCLRCLDWLFCWSFSRWQRGKPIPSRKRKPMPMLRLHTELRPSKATGLLRLPPAGTELRPPVMALRPNPKITARRSVTTRLLTKPLPKRPQSTTRIGTPRIR